MPDPINQEVAVHTNMGDIVIELFADTPITTANFLNYVTTNRYDNSFFHRLVKGFVLQGGGYYYNGTSTTTVPAFAPITNEASAAHPNVAQTVAMARQADLNSATSQFFINLVDNRANLTAPYAVFGQVIQGWSTVTSIASLTVYDASGGVPGSAFKELPLRNYTSGAIAPSNLVSSTFDVLAVANADSFNVGETDTVSGSLVANDSDLDDATFTIALVNGVASVGQVVTLTSGAHVTVNANGTFSYDPNHAFDGLTAGQSATDSFTYTLANGSLVYGTATALVTIAGAGAGGPPIPGTTGDDALNGSEFDDLFRLEQGGNDSATGGGRNDGFFFGYTLDNLDSADGGPGTDSLAIQGDYPALVLGNVLNIEALVLVSGANGSFGDVANNRYDYNVTLNDGNIAAGQTLVVQAKDLLPGEDLVLNASAETNGQLRVFAGQGTDTLTGGAGNDGFFFGADGNYTAADRVHGGPGLDSIAFRGNYSGAQTVIFDDAGMSGIDALVALSGHTREYGGPIAPGGFDYDLTTANGNVIAGQLMQAIASTLQADESFRFDGRAELDGAFRILAGAGDDSLFGGAGNDILYGGLGADQLTGSGGSDTFLYRSTLESSTALHDTLVGFDATDVIDLGFIDAIAGTPANELFSFIDGAAFSANGTGGELRAVLSGSDWTIEADTNGDGVADFSLLITGTIAEPITAGDFIL